LAACVTVERGSWVGIGSLVREGVHIGSDVMIGAGSVVLHDIPDGALAYGVPAAVIRKHVPLPGTNITTSSVRRKHVF